jgi:GNAT superfamily N-acetyltransferase
MAVAGTPTRESVVIRTVQQHLDRRKAERYLEGEQVADGRLLAALDPVQRRSANTRQFRECLCCETPFLTNLSNTSADLMSQICDAAPKRTQPQSLLSSQPGRGNHPIFGINFRQLRPEMGSTSSNGGSLYPIFGMDWQTIQAKPPNEGSGGSGPAYLSGSARHAAKVSGANLAVGPALPADCASESARSSNWPTRITEPALLISRYVPRNRLIVFALLRSIEELYPGGLKWLDGRLSDVEAGRAECTLAWLGSSPVAVAIQTPKGSGQIKLSTFLVAQDFRGQRIGHTLLRWLTERWRMSDVEQAYVTAPADRSEAVLGLFASFGFRQVAFCPARYGPGRDELVLSWDV